MMSGTFCPRCGAERVYVAVGNKPDPSYAVKEHTLEDCFREIHKIVLLCRPHVVMNKSVTSGREFQEAAQQLLDRIDHIAR